MGDLVDQAVELAERLNEVIVPDFLDALPDPFIVEWARGQLLIAADTLANAAAQLTFHHAS